jgi:hypothetical protein
MAVAAPIRELPPNARQAQATAVRARWTLYGGAEGGGKTFWLAMITLLMCRRWPGIECVLARYDYSDVMSPTQIYDVFHRLVPRNEISQIYRSAPAWTRLTNGSRVTFLGLKDYSPSAEYGCVGVDQAEEVPQDTLRLLNGRLRQALPRPTDRGEERPRYRMLLTCNPHPNIEWFLQMEAEHPEEFVFIRSLPADNASNLPEDFIQSRRLSYTEDQFRRFIEGSWDVFEGQALPEFDRNVHVVTPFEIPRTWPVWRGIDYGTNAPTVCEWFTQDPDGNYFVFREYEQRGQNAETNARAILAMSQGDRLISTWVDPRMAMVRDLERPLEWSAFKEFGRWLGHIMLASEGPADRGSTRANRLQAWKLALQQSPERIHYLTHQAPAPRLYIFNTCTRLIWELPRLQYRDAAQGYEDVEKTEDHAYDAGGFVLSHVIGNTGSQKLGKPKKWVGVA